MNIPEAHVPPGGYLPGGYPPGGQPPGVYPPGVYPPGGQPPGGYPPGGQPPGGYPVGGFPPGGSTPGYQQGSLGNYYEGQPSGIPPGGFPPPGQQAYSFNSSSGGFSPPLALPPLGPQSGGLPPLGTPPGAYGAPAGAPPFVGSPGGAGYAQPGAGAPGYPLQGGFAQQTGGQLTAAGGYAGLPPGGYAQGSYAGQSAGYGPYQSGAAGRFQTTPYPGYSATTGGAYSSSQGTLKPHPNFNAQADAQALRTAMKGWGTDEDAIINILCTRTCPQRLQIVSTYKQMYGRDLIADIKSELRGRFEDVMVGLLYPMHEYLARELRRAVAGLGTDEDCLIEILCTRSNEDIRLMKQYYRTCFGKDLESDIRGDTSGHFRRLLLAMCNGQREEGGALDPARARNDAQRLQQAGVLRWGTDESVFIQILGSQSYEQLRLVFHEYNVLANHTIVEAIRREMSGDLQKALLAVVTCVYNIPFYFAEKLYKSMKGFGTSDKALIRIIVSRCEVDLVQIKDEYLKNFKLQLEASIQSDTSGDYRKALLALVHGN